MSKFRDNTHKYLMLLGALFFLFASTSTQACVLADHDCANPPQANSPAQSSLHRHAPASEQVHASSPASHLLPAAAHDDDGECCQLIQADLGSFAKAQVGNSSPQQLPSDWFHFQSANVSSFHRIGFALREIISPPPQFFCALYSSVVSPLNAGRAPPSAVSA